MKSLFYSLLCSLLVIPGAAAASEATIVGLYENCEPVSSTIFVEPGQLDPAVADQIAARATADASGLGFEQALPVMIASLEASGVSNIQVRKQGNCDVRGHGKFVEATVAYCGPELRQAEVYIDGALFFRQSGTNLEYEDFLAAARDKLSAVGIVDDPRVYLNNIADCDAQQASG